MSVDPPPLIDAHFHVFKHGMPFAPTAWTRPAYEHTVEQHLKVLDEHGVSGGVIAAASLFGDYNDYTRWAVRTHRRLRGTVIVEPTISADKLDTMKREGVVGVRFMWYERELPDLTILEYQAFFARLRSLGLHVHLNIEPARLPQVLEILAAQGVRLVLDHMGHPQGGLDTPAFKATLAGLEAGTLWVKLSGAFRATEPPEQVDAYVAAMVSANRERLFWGSDCPFVGRETTTYADVVSHFDRWTRDPALRAQIARNAFEFYFL